MGAPDSPSHSGELWPWNQVESKLQVGGMAFCGWAELGQQEPTLPALDLPQSNPRPREPSFHTLQKLWQPSPSSEGIQSWVYKHAGAYRETGREVLLLSVSSSWIFVANTLMPDLITAPRRSLKGLPLPQHLLLSGLRLLWCLLHSPWQRDIYIWCWCWDELCTHSAERRFNEEISFLFLALAFNGF